MQYWNGRGRVPARVRQEQAEIIWLLDLVSRRPEVDAAIRALRSFVTADTRSAEEIRSSEELGRCVNEWLSDPELSRVFSRTQFETLVLHAIGFEKAGLQLTISEMLSVRGRVVVVVDDLASATAMRAKVRPGQIWLRYDLIAADSLRDVAAWAAFQLPRIGRRIRKSGRPTGSKDARLQAFIRQCDPSWTNDEIYRRLREAGLAEGELRVDDTSGLTESKLRRVRKIKRLAHQRVEGTGPAN